MLAQGHTGGAVRVERGESGKEPLSQQAEEALEQIPRVMRECVPDMIATFKVGDAPALLAAQARFRARVTPLMEVIVAEAEGSQPETAAVLRRKVAEIQERFDHLDQLVLRAMDSPGVGALQ